MHLRIISMRQQCPLLAQSGHHDYPDEWPLSGVKRTWVSAKPWTASIGIEPYFRKNHNSCEGSYRNSGRGKIWPPGWGRAERNRVGSLIAELIAPYRFRRR